jgi:hypothetical protein
LPDTPTESAAPEVDNILSRTEALFKLFYPLHTLEGIPKDFLRSLTTVANISIRLESAHMEQRRGIATILKTGSHYWQRHPPIASSAPDRAPPGGQPVRMGSGLQPDLVDDADFGTTMRRLRLVVGEGMLVKKVDDFFQRVRYLSPLKGTRVLTGTGYEYHPYRRSVQVSGAGCEHEEAIAGDGTFGLFACFCRPADRFSLYTYLSFS